MASRPRWLWPGQSSPMYRHWLEASWWGMPKQPTRDLWQKLEKTEQFIPIHITGHHADQHLRWWEDENPICVVINEWRMAQVWAANETSVTLANMSMFNTLKGLLMSIENTFRDPDRERMAHTQLHAHKNWLPGMTQRNTWPTLRCSQKDQLQPKQPWRMPTSEDVPQSILLKVYSQTSLPSSMDNWKAAVCNLDCLQRRICWTEVINSSEAKHHSLRQIPPLPPKCQIPQHLWT